MTHREAKRLDLSYAQNLEDYHLAQAFAEQAFAGQSEGFYIDVGAGHPVADNVSCWFYLNGWRGIVVEPQAELAALYAHVRPRDIVECCALGRTAGTVDFHAVERLHGFSTLIEDVANRAETFGASHTTRRVQMKTLAGICEEHGVGRIDFLKIDVEGAEGDVLAGGDFARFRPRVILAEALAPGTLAEAWQGWQPFLLERDYEFVLFEGLNRFYVDKRDAALLARFPRERADWLVVPHLGHTNRAPVREDHPDHAFAKGLVAAFLAELPRMDREALLALVLRDVPDAERRARPDEATKKATIDRLFPPARFITERAGLAEIDAPTLEDFKRRLLDSDAFRVMTGRIAASYDGGQILD